MSRKISLLSILLCSLFLGFCSPPPNLPEPTTEVTYDASALDLPLIDFGIIKSVIDPCYAQEPNMVSLGLSPHLPWMYGITSPVTTGWHCDKNCFNYDSTKPNRGDKRKTPLNKCWSSGGNVCGYFHSSFYKYGYDFVPGKPIFIDGISDKVPIFSAYEGEITYVKSDWSAGSGFGNHVKIKHGAYYSTYAHLYKIADWLKERWNAGDRNIRVSRGTFLGLMGRTGFSTGIHLHFQFEDSNNNSIPFSDKFVEWDGNKTITECAQLTSKNVVAGSLENKGLWENYSSLFLSKYNELLKEKCNIGAPFANKANNSTHQATPFVHEILSSNGSKVLIQDFAVNNFTSLSKSQIDNHYRCLRDSKDGQSALIYNEGQTSQNDGMNCTSDSHCSSDLGGTCKQNKCYFACKQAVYHLSHVFWGAYKCLAQQGSTTMGGVEFLGSPCSDAKETKMTDGKSCNVDSDCSGNGKCENSQCVYLRFRQNFNKGFMWWDERNQTVRVHFLYHADLAKLSGCGISIDHNPPQVGNTCDKKDRCLGMGCSSDKLPPDSSVFKTPSTGTTVFLRRGKYKHTFPNESCYFLFYKDFNGVRCISNKVSSNLLSAPTMCTTGSFIKKMGNPTVYRLENSQLRPLCGSWTEAAFQQKWGYPFEVVIPVSPLTFAKIASKYPVATGIYPHGKRAVKCGDVGYKCGKFSSLDTACFGTNGILDCGSCKSSCKCGEKRCVGNTLEACSSDCKKWIFSKQCRKGCSNGTCKTKCDCITGSVRCHNGNVEVCNCIWSIKEKCSVNGKKCVQQSCCTPSKEVCDGKDNDCDGSIDSFYEDCYTGPIGTLGKGTCKKGQRLCGNGKWLNCIGESKPRNEWCDGKDNDCNGKIDDNLPSYKCGNQKGVCKGSTRICGGKPPQILGCDEKRFKQNNSSYQKVETLCDGKDNDCDGQTDEGCQCSQGQKQNCGSSTGECKQGIQTCQNGQWGGCVGGTKPQTELCNGLDDDCDGQTDEGFVLGKSCANGIGECRRSGITACKPDGSTTICNAAPGAPSNEVCDGKDNNCDGQIDEGCKCTNNTTRACYTGSSGCIKNGTVYNCITPCKAGTQTCVSGKWGGCTGEILPVSETCNRQDDDCDGQIDEQLTRSCNTTCGSGTETCSNGSWAGCSAPQPGTEVCDGKDNDCDGKTDEGRLCPTKSVCLQGSCSSCMPKCTCDSGWQLECWGAPGQTTGHRFIPNNNWGGNQYFLCAPIRISDGLQICPEKTPGPGCRCSNANWNVLTSTYTAPSVVPQNCSFPLTKDHNGYAWWVTCSCWPNRNQPCYTGPKGTAKQGSLCNVGNKYCDPNGNWSTCQGEKTPQNEICSDGKDNDCDGQVDETCP